MSESTNRSNENCRERVIETVRAIWGNDYKAIEAETGVSAAKWKRMCNRVQQPTIEMIQSIAKTRPYFLQWMMTGNSDAIVQLSPLGKWQEQIIEALRVSPRETTNDD